LAWQASASTADDDDAIATHARNMLENMETIDSRLDVCVLCTSMAAINPRLRQNVAEYVRERLAKLEGLILQMGDSDPEFEAELDLRGDAFREKLAELASLPAIEA
jgi:hypothetical protein